MREAWSGPIDRVDEYRWRIPRKYKSEMRTDGIVYASGEMMRVIKTDNSLEQVANVACLPGIVGFSMAMPDIHYGYGFPIGGVAATDVKEGVVSAGGVGYDFNCGVRLVRTELTRREVEPRIKDLVNQVFVDVPSGVGSKGKVRVDAKTLRRALTQGSQWAVSEGMGWPEDPEHIEDGGKIEGADPAALSERAIQRGRPQLGTLGAGNHFLEVQVVEEILDEQTATALGITQAGQVTVMIHTGSRGLGYQVCDDSLKEMQRAVQKYGIELPDRQLACAPVESPEGRKYLSAMAAAANYAWANRQCITHWAREAFERVLDTSARRLGMGIIYDVAHNVAKLEEHEVNGERRRLCVHRKGATRALGPGHLKLLPLHRETGQPVIVPGDMGTASYLLVGTERAMKETWGSTCHGAGRVMSRHGAIRAARGRNIADELASKGVYVRAASRQVLAEEMPEAYKDVDEVVQTCHGAGISKLVARVRPIGVMKG
ncbi:MAG: RtcB family protein [Armatimonadota bacterium]|nr:MAG: RtcB family protein [Armatimonadota bacterium]